jgi:hypothetical protein
MHMQRPELMRLVFGVGMLTIVMLALSACGGGSSAQEQQANKVHHIPEDSQVYEGEPLPAGRYDTEEFKPSMSFTLEKGWSRGGAELHDIWDLQTSRTTRFGSYLPAPRRSGGPKGSDGLKRGPAPEDMVGWLQANPHMKSEKPKPTSVGGEKGVQFDAIVTGVVESPECPGCVDVPLFHNSDGETTGVEKGEKVRFIVLEDVKGQTVTIFIESSADGFEEFLAKGQKVVDSVKWGGS